MRKIKTINLRLTAILLALVFAVGMIPFTPVTTAVAEATTRTLYEFDFETDPFSNGWVQVDIDGDGKTWYWGTAYQELAHGGTGYCYSYSYYMGALTPNDRLASPIMTLSAEGVNKVSVWARGDGTTSYREKFHFAYIDTAEGTVHKFSDDFTTENGYNQYTATIPAEAIGKSIRIAIVHANCTGQNRLTVDDFTVTNTVDNTLDEALNFYDTLPLKFSTGEDYPWYATQTQNGTKYARSGNAVKPNTASWLETTHTSTTQEAISFDFVAYGEGEDYDTCDFYIDGNKIFSYGEYSYSLSFGTFECIVSPGTHTYRWEYRKDGSVNSYYDMFALRRVLVTKLNTNTKVCGVSISTENCNDILGDGVFSYDFNTDTVYVNGSCTYAGTIIRGSGITVCSRGFNTLTGTSSEPTIDLKNYSTITGENSALSVRNTSTAASSAAIAYEGERLTVRQIRLTVTGQNGITGTSDGALIIDRADIGVQANGSDNDDNVSIGGFKEIKTYGDILFAVPSGGSYKNGTVLSSAGKKSKLANFYSLPVGMSGIVEDSYGDGLYHHLIGFSDFYPAQKVDIFDFEDVDIDPYAATYAGLDRMYAYDAERGYQLFCFDPDELNGFTYLGETLYVKDHSEKIPLSSAYNYRERKLYTLVYDYTADEQVLYVTDPETGTVVKTYIFPEHNEGKDYFGVCSDEYGNIYAMNYLGELFVVYSPEDGFKETRIGVFGSRTDYRYQDICYNYDDGLIYWAYAHNGRNYLATVDPVDMVFRRYTPIGNGYRLNSLLIESHDIPADGQIAYWNFEYEASMEGWDMVDKDGDGYNWEFTRNRWDNAYDRYGYLSSRSYLNGPGGLSPENYAYTPAVVMPKGGTNYVSFTARSDEDYPNENFNVFACLHDDENAPLVQLSGVTTAPGEWMAYEYEIPKELNGKRVRIVIAHLDTVDEYELSLDCLRIWNDGTGSGEEEDERRGDVDGNGVIEAKDYLMAKRAVLNSFQLDEGQKYRADIDGNDAVEASDYLKIKRHVLGSYTIPGWEN
ncbi:MAG: choice-of-anchor J domain-containing protein [Clostridia bacterium]|nr:choice-of-anchor J domain-containing protein [Clostridia bacterium]